MNKYSIVIVFNNMNKKVIIYGLFNPFNGDCFYIGKTIRDLNTRLFEHINEKGTNLNKDRIINNIIRQGKQPLIKELLTVDDYYINELDVNYWEYVEKYFIKFTREVLKEPIVNVASGGNYSMIEGKFRIIRQYDFNGNYIMTHKSISDAARYLKNNNKIKSKINTIRKCIIDNCKSTYNNKTYNYYWSFDDVKSIDYKINNKKKHKKYEWSNDIRNKIINRRNEKENYIKQIKEEREKRKEERIIYNSLSQVIEERKRKEKESRKKYRKSEKGKLIESIRRKKKRLEKKQPIPQ